MDDPGFDDTYFQSTNSDNQHLFAQSMAELVLEFRYEVLLKFINNIEQFLFWTCSQHLHKIINAI